MQQIHCNIPHSYLFSDLLTERRAHFWNGNVTLRIVLCTYCLHVCLRYADTLWSHSILIKIHIPWLHLPKQGYMRYLTEIKSLTFKVIKSLTSRGSNSWLQEDQIYDFQGDQILDFKEIESLTFKASDHVYCCSAAAIYTFMCTHISIIFCISQHENNIECAVSKLFIAKLRSLWHPANRSGFHSTQPWNLFIFSLLYLLPCTECADRALFRVPNSEAHWPWCHR